MIKMHKKQKDGCASIGAAIFIYYNNVYSAGRLKPLRYPLPSRRGCDGPW